MAISRKKAYAEQKYWGLPVPGFGNLDAQLVVLGLAPGAHGANRTGRVFTGDRSGDWLYRALFKQGFANQPDSRDRQDGLILQDAYVSCVVKCCPPDNRPQPEEVQSCGDFLKAELNALGRARVYVALGQIAFQAAWPLLFELTLNAGQGEGSGVDVAQSASHSEEGARFSSLFAARPKFAHGVRFYLPGGKLLLLSYHPSQQNTFTGRLTEPMFDAVFAQARHHLASI